MFNWWKLIKRVVYTENAVMAFIGHSKIIPIFKYYGDNLNKINRFHKPFLYQEKKVLSNVHLLIKLTACRCSCLVFASRNQNGVGYDR